MEGRASSLLLREHMEAQLATIELLAAMFPEPGELDIPPETVRWTNILGDWYSKPSSGIDPTDIPAELPLALNLCIEMEDKTGKHNILLNISVPIRSAEIDAVEVPPMRYFVRQPTWLSKAEIQEFSSSMPKTDIFAAIDWIREEAPGWLKNDNSESKSFSTTDELLVRVWFYFPSLSTREKRDDLVNHASEYHLTGFVLAGKPGVLCLEGTSSNVDAYMKFIKTHSWGDIPSHQKKVSERYREIKSSDSGQEGTVGVKRVFSEMEEITGVLGDRGGARANRGDMKALEIWLNEKGLGDAFEKVIF